MGRRADDYHMRSDGNSCPGRKVFTWNADGTAKCVSCRRSYPDHVRSTEADKPRFCVICQEDHT